MPKLPPIGKIDAEFFNQIIFPRLGESRQEVAIGPQHGVDVGIIELGEYALALTADPVFIVPQYGWERAAWFAFHILFSDAVTSGLKPAYLAIDMNLPPSNLESELETVWGVIDREARKYNVAIVAGHTARYGGCAYPMVGGAVAIAAGARNAYVSPKFIKSGDAIIVTKGPAIEATGIFAAMFPQYIAERLGKDIAARAGGLFYKMSVLDDAMAAVSVGVRDDGVSAMHDATECGLWGGIFEMVNAAGKGAIMEKGKIPVDSAAQAVCELYSIDPFTSISEGTLIISVRSHKADMVLQAILDKGIDAAIVGEVRDREGIELIENGASRRIEHPQIDPFWEAFYSALENQPK